MSRKCKCAKRRKTTTKRRRVKRNAHPSAALSRKAALLKIRKAGIKHLPEEIRRLAKTATGRAQLRLFADFWRIGKVPSVRKIPGPKKLTLAVGMGYSPSMSVSSKPRGKRGKTKTIRGTWHVLTRANGKKAVGKTIYFMTGRKLNGQMRMVGYAPHCFYIPYKDVETEGSHKSGSNWKHLFSDDGGSWPEVYADTRTLGKNTNFVVTNGTFTVSDWIRR